MSELSPSSLDYTIHVKEEHEEYRKVIRDFSQKLVLPKVQKIESENALEDELVTRLCETGIMGITFPEEYAVLGLTT
jgi:Acyl-CoA dehydrogenases